MGSPLGVLGRDRDRDVLYRFINLLHRRMNLLDEVVFSLRQFLDSPGHIVQLLEHRFLARGKTVHPPKANGPTGDAYAFQYEASECDRFHRIES